MSSGYLLPSILAVVLLASAGAALAALAARRRGLDSLDVHLCPRAIECARSPRPGQPVHLLLCIADHFEPGNGGVTPDVARRTVAALGRRLSQALPGNSVTATGARLDTRSSIPIDMYDPEEVDALGRAVPPRTGRSGDPSPSRRRHVGKPATDAAELQGDPGAAAWIARPAPRDRRTGLRLRARELGAGQLRVPTDAGAE